MLLNHYLNIIKLMIAISKERKAYSLLRHNMLLKLHVHYRHTIPTSSYTIWPYAAGKIEHSIEVFAIFLLPEWWQGGVILSLYHPV
jgi:hypothetical protein